MLSLMIHSDYEGHSPLQEQNYIDIVAEFYNLNKPGNKTSSSSHSHIWESAQSVRYLTAVYITLLKMDK